MDQASDELLTSLGIELIDGELQPAAHAECIRIARALGAADLQTVGFWPADPEVAVPPLAIQLGLSLAELYGATVAYVDANVYFPAFPLGEQDDGQEGEPGDSIFATKWLRGSLALVLPKWVGEVGAGVPQLKAIIDGTRDRYAFILVDLTGFDQIGDHLNAVELLDGVVLVARAGHTREKDLLRLQNQVPEAKNLGVVLVG